MGLNGGERGCGQVPSRTLKPISSQLMVLTGGGGNVIVKV